MKPLLNVFCSIQRALLGHVTANLRAVYVIVDEELESYNLFFIMTNLYQKMKKSSLVLQIQNL